MKLFYKFKRLTTKRRRILDPKKSKKNSNPLIFLHCLGEECNGKTKNQRF